MDVVLALKINKLVHDECKDAPHDIGARIEEIVRKHNKYKPQRPKVYKCANCGKNYSQIFSFYCQDCLL